MEMANLVDHSEHLSELLAYMINSSIFSQDSMNLTPFV